MSADVQEVKRFWNANPCNAKLSDNPERKKYFEEISQRRFNGREWHVPILARFRDFRDKKVLEIGCGIATDGAEFAKHGASYVGVDLTPQSIALSRERFEILGIPGEFHVANAEERLPFDDDTFDHVYSFGVIHHSPRTEAIVDEIYRVLKPGGTFTVMVYNRSSINYYVEIMGLRRVFRWLLYPAFMPRALSILFGFDEWKLNGHREAIIGRGRLTKEQWISMNTDGPYCPLAKVYGHREAAELFAKFANVRQEVWEFNSDHWSFLGRLLPRKLERTMGRYWGWHRVVHGNKPRC
jgi:ubiquinone/menaquinone biosynthesis C-methylase UbiE